MYPACLIGFRGCVMVVSMGCFSEYSRVVFADYPRGGSSRIHPISDIEPDQVIRMHEQRTCGGLLFLKMPRAVPTIAGRSRDQPVYALDERQRWSVVRRHC